MAVRIEGRSWDQEMQTLLERYGEAVSFASAGATGTETFTKAAPGDQDNDVAFGGYASVPRDSDRRGVLRGN